MFIYNSAMISALGLDETEIIKNLYSDQSKLQLSSDYLLNHQSTYLGLVGQKYKSENILEKKFNSVNNKLALTALIKLKKSLKDLTQYIPKNRIAVIVGTSTSGFSDAENAFKRLNKHNNLGNDFHYKQQEIGGLSEFVKNYLDLSGPSYTISTACSSSARTLISAQHLMQCGLADAVIVGGCDTICKLTTQGFDSLQSVSQSICKPFETTRDGINIGEAAAFMILTKKRFSKSSLKILGIGQSSDAYHMSAPDPSGLGAERSMLDAITKANIRCEDVGYINAHGTGTKLNDSMESMAIFNLFKDNTPVTSTKNQTGHTLGASGILELSICWLILKKSLEIPVQQNFDLIDPNIQPINVNTQYRVLKNKIILSNSFAFGGNNVSIIIGEG
ncbi:beta-ketoacyl-[acyl-carrier-protein] synthase II [Paraphotobacterium marinum]|uniref:Beta-ketoacyl-[acyl-carrier-protein] synthase II n=1 Tax=Paraphotobacterium marinum TaxID=1755811 RepID=A0A220VHK9_9GAMM|nr:beta-ketoacyl-ACP synthase [Paraphotobacterium marinum]ASK79672.1 beta-ketoacyl-[acyl-carrier-protein] synthase II [Paraphotobacterium marinum]